MPERRNEGIGAPGHYGPRRRLAAPFTHSYTVSHSQPCRSQACRSQARDVAARSKRLFMDSYRGCCRRRLLVHGPLSLVYACRRMPRMATHVSGGHGLTIMAANLKALIIVLGVGAIILYFARPLALRFSDPADYRRRCVLWLILTAAGFLCPNTWWFVLVAAPLLLWAGHRDSNPIALYLLLFQVVPSIFVNIPTIGINKLFDLDIDRLLSLCVLVPAAWRMRRSAATTGGKTFELPDVLLLLYGLLQVAFFVRPDTPGNAVLSDSLTNALRRAFLYFIDIYVVYFAVRRWCSDRRSMLEALAALCLCCAIAAPIAVFETLRHWLLYSGIAARWSPDPMAHFYVVRDHILRAQAASGSPLSLGYILAIACGLWLYLWSYADSWWRKRIAVLCLWLGLLAAYSRGPWIGAVTIYLAFACVAPQRLSGLVKTGSALVLLTIALLISPLGDKVIAALPFFGGSVDSANYLYRRQLAAESWQLIRQHPWLGDQFAYAKLGDLRQGQGIIDIVNTYIEVALFYGLIGLSLFLGFMLTALLRAYRVARQSIRSDPDLATLGAALVACIAGTLLMLANCSFIFAYSKLYFVLAAFAVAYAKLAPLTQHAAAVDYAATPPARLYPLRPARRS